MSNQTQNLNFENNLTFSRLKFICHLDFGIWILSQDFIKRKVNYEKETSQEYKKVYQEREGSDSSRSFRFERTGWIN